jgi:hypothetical protein
MTATPKLILRTIERMPRNGKSELLRFEPGLNVIVGPPNSGKTKLLGVLDYLVGDRGQPADAFGDDVAEKYVAARAEFDVDGSLIAVERSWQKHGERQRVLVNGLSIPDTEFSDAWLEILNIPAVSFPQGDPHRELIWRELSWRSLWHQMFRKQTMWTDIADKQPESEQFACLLTFLGQAQHLFAPELGTIAHLLDERKQIESKKQQIVVFLNQATRDLLGAHASPDFGPGAIDDFVSSISDRIGELEQMREGAIAAAATYGRDASEASGLESMSARAALLAGTVTALDRALVETEKRISELVEHDSLLSNEVRRLKRSRVAGEMLADLRVTNCPACDQSVEGRALSANKCYVCTQAVSEPVAVEAAVRRVDFEVEQIESERAELAELITALRLQSRALRDEHTSAASELRQISDMMSTLSSPNTAALHADVSAFDIEIGRLQERIVHVERLRQLVDRRDEISHQLDEIATKLNDLDAHVAKRRTSLALETSSDMFSDAMADYLQALNRGRHGRWTQGPIGLELRPRGFSFTVAGSRWQRRLGGSLTLYFLLAYHFALLRLSGQESRHYPGLAVLDLPASLEDGADVRDKENYILEPFSASMKRGKLRGCQLIAAGAAFENLKDAHRIELTTVWRPSGRA